MKLPGARRNSRERGLRPAIRQSYSLIVPGGGTTVITAEDAEFRAFTGHAHDTVVLTVDRFPDVFWSAVFQTRDASPLLPGLTYEDATRYPFNASFPNTYPNSTHGLSLFGFIGNNTLTGSFTIREFTFSGSIDPSAPPTVNSFAADFIQYDEGLPDSWNRAFIRFNSSVPIPSSFVPVPEPATYGVGAVLALGVLCVGRLRRKAAAPIIDVQ